MYIDWNILQDNKQVRITNYTLGVFIAFALDEFFILINNAPIEFKKYIFRVAILNCISQKKIFYV